MDLGPRHAGRAAPRIGRPAAALLAAAACLAAESAQAAGGEDAVVMTIRSQVDAASAPAWADSDEAIAARRSPLGLRWEASPRARLAGAPFEPLRSGPGTAPPIDYRLWFGDRRTEVGVGLVSASSTVFAVRHQLSADSRLTFDASLIDGGDAQMRRARRTAFDLGFESSAWPGLANGNLLRAQLSAHSSLALRLRGGRLGLYLGVKITGNE